MEKLLEDLSSLGEALQNSTTNEAIIQLHQFLQKHLYVKDIVEFHGKYAVKLNNNNLPKGFGRLFFSYYTKGVSTLTCRQTSCRLITLGVSLLA